MAEEASTYNGLKIVYSLNGVGKIRQIYAEKWVDHLLTPHTRINSKGTTHLNVRPKTIKILGENISSKISHIAHSNIFSEVSPRAKETNKQKNGTTSNEKAFV